jgi:glutamate/tyrosine decarboxylase-like PLP-dependent enzyme
MSTTETASGKKTGEPESLDKVRDILFGVQMRDYEQRISQLEDKLMRESALLREEVKKRFDSLEIYIKGEINAVSDKLKSEREDRQVSVKELTREIKEAVKASEKKNDQFDTQLTQAQRDLRQALLDQSRTLSEEIQSKYTEMVSSLQRESQSLRNDKTDRTTLASLLTEVAMRLAEDGKPASSRNGK